MTSFSAKALVTNGYVFGTSSAFCTALMPAHASVLTCFRQHLLSAVPPFLRKKSVFAFAAALFGA
jgi:hypothetical protein